MNAADMALTAGFNDLLATAGDSVTFRGSAVSAVVNWTPQHKAGKEMVPSFSEKQESEIEIPIGSVSPAPRVGEYITTTNPVGTSKHRIEFVAINGFAYVLKCEVNR